MNVLSSALLIGQKPEGRFQSPADRKPSDVPPATALRDIRQRNNRQVTKLICVCGKFGTVAMQAVYKLLFVFLMIRGRKRVR
jgi:hypothetical protein